MLSRTAENLYWMARYIERADSTARLVEMANRIAIVPGEDNLNEWRSIAAVAGSHHLLPSDKNGFDKHTILRHLIIDTQNPSSICSCITKARENARAVRTALTQEMWEAINNGWRKLQSVDEQDLVRNLSDLMDWVKNRSASLRGASEIGMLRNEGYDFLRLGGYVERADMTLRLLDVKYYVLLPETEVVGGARDHHQWTSVLRAASALRAYHHVYRDDYSPWKIADFLILNPMFPRSLIFCYEQIGVCLKHLLNGSSRSQTCFATANSVVAHLSDIGMGEIFQEGLHEFITEKILINQQLSSEIAKVFYFE
ncbi:MAG: alpha-E domain-containing protein [Pseudomonadota bacterium]